MRVNVLMSDKGAFLDLKPLRRHWGIRERRCWCRAGIKSRGRHLRRWLTDRRRRDDDRRRPFMDSKCPSDLPVAEDDETGRNPVKRCPTRAVNRVWARLKARRQGLFSLTTPQKTWDSAFFLRRETLSEFRVWWREWNDTTELLSLLCFQKKPDKKLIWLS